MKKKKSVLLFKTDGDRCSGAQCRARRSQAGGRSRAGSRGMENGCDSGNRPLSEGATRQVKIVKKFLLTMRVSVVC